MPAHHFPLRSDPAQRRAAQIVPAVVAALLYLAALGNGFAYDDVRVIQQNDWVRQGRVLAHALSLPYWPSGALYRPLTSFSYGIDWWLGGGHPLLFHAVNIAWFAIGTALVCRVTLRWWPPLAAACAGLLFALQPLHVEAVANIVGRAELLAVAALLGVALVASNDGRASDAGSGPRPSNDILRLLAVGVLSALAFAAKETGAVAPLIAWASSRLNSFAGFPATPPRPGARAGDTRRVTLAALVGTALVLAQRFAVLGTLAGDTPHAAFLAATPTQSFALALATLPRAVGMLLLPQFPRIDYSPTSAALRHPPLVLVALGALLVVAGVAIFVRHAWRPSRRTWAALFSIATLAPVSNLVVHTGVVLADRTLYGPSVGSAILVGGAVAALWAGRRRSPLVYASLAAVTAATMAGVVFAARSISVWHDTSSVLTAMQDRAPTSYRSYYLLVADRKEREHGPSAEAQREYAAAIALFDGDIGLLYDASANAAGLGDTTDALNWLGATLAQNPDQRRARTSLALLELRHGDTTAARTTLRTGLAREPDQHFWRALLDSATHAHAHARRS